MKRLTSQQRQDGIIDAAVKLFSQIGFHGATTREIARAAGISEALLFRHFPDKGRLYAAILQRKMDEQVPRLLTDLPDDEGPRILLKALAVRIVHLHEEDNSFLRLLLFSALENHKLSDLFFKKRNLPMIEFLKNYFVEAVESGHMRPLDPETTAFAFVAMVMGFVQSRILFKIPQVMKESAEQRIEKYVELFIQGVLP